MSDPRAEMTARRRKRFLDSLSEHGIVARAVRAAGGGRRTFYDWRAADPDFAAEWDAALALGLAALEDEAMERAWRGHRRGVWYKGRKVGVERKPSDGLLMFVLRNRLPERYRVRPESRRKLLRDGRDPDRLTDEELEHAIMRLSDPANAGPAPEPSEETRRATALRGAGFLPVPPRPSRDVASAEPDSPADAAPGVSPGPATESLRDHLAGGASPAALKCAGEGDNRSHSFEPAAVSPGAEPGAPKGGP